MMEELSFLAELTPLIASWKWPVKFAFFIFQPVYLLSTSTNDPYNGSFFFKYPDQVSRNKTRCCLIKWAFWFPLHHPITTRLLKKSTFCSIGIFPCIYKHNKNKCSDVPFHLIKKGFDIWYFFLHVDVVVE